MNVSKILNLSVIDFGEEECEPGHAYGPDVRSYYLIHYVISGAGTLEVDNRTWEIHEGQSFLIYPGETASYQADPVHPWHYTWIGYTGDASADLTQITDFSRSQRVLSAAFPDQAWQALSQMYNDIKRLYLGELASLGGLFRFLAMLSPSEGENVVLNLTQYEKAIHYMQENFASPISIQDIAKAVNLSRSQLFRIFKRTCGNSPKQVLDDMRLSHAKHLLRLTQLSVDEVAQYAGFSSSSYLNKVFQKYRGMTPTAYRAYRKELENRQSVRKSSDPDHEKTS